jgi:hypothetical protein
MIARMDSQIEKMEAAVIVFEEALNKMDVTDLEANAESITSESEHLEVSKEEAAVETTGALEDRYGDRHLAVGRHREPKKWTQGKCGSRKKLAAAHRRVAVHGLPARRKGRGQKGLRV